MSIEIPQWKKNVILGKGENMEDKEGNNTEVSTSANESIESPESVFFTIHDGVSSYEEIIYNGSKVISSGRSQEYELTKEEAVARLKGIIYNKEEEISHMQDEVKKGKVMLATLESAPNTKPTDLASPFESL